MWGGFDTEENNNINNAHKYAEDGEYNPYSITEVLVLPPEDAKNKIRKVSSRNSGILLIFWAFQMLLSYLLQSFLYAESIPEDLKWLYPLSDKFSVNVSDNVKEWLNMGFSYGVPYLIVIPLLLCLGNSGTLHTTKTYFQKPRMTKGQWFEWSSICYTLSITINIVSIIVFSMISLMVSGGNEEEGLNALSILPGYDDIFGLIVFFITVAILAPIFEELLLRGTVLTHTLRYGQWFSFIVIGVSFGLLHGNFQQMFYAAVIGIINCFIAYKAKSIIPAIFTHLLINTPSAILGVLLTKIDFQEYMRLLDMASNTADEAQMQEHLDSMTAWMMENSNALTFMALIGLFLLILFIIGIFNLVKKLKYYRDEFICGNACASLTTKQKIYAYVSSPVTILFIVIMLAMAVQYAARGL